MLTTRITGNLNETRSVTADNDDPAPTGPVVPPLCYSLNAWPVRKVNIGIDVSEHVMDFVNEMDTSSADTSSEDTFGDTARWETRSCNRTPLPSVAILPSPTCHV